MSILIEDSSNIIQSISTFSISQNVANKAKKFNSKKQKADSVLEQNFISCKT